MDHETIIIGGGLSGLTCARALHAAGRRSVVLEAGDDVGGRVRSDTVDGFTLDRGFQVLLTSYPEARQWLDYEALDLQVMTPGALVWRDGARHRISDPFRRPQDLPATLRAPVGSWLDKARIGWMRWQSQRGTLDNIFERPEMTALALVQHYGFSEKMIESFLRPWLGGIFLETELSTSSRMLEFVFRFFADGDAAIPAAGMQAIPRQLAAGLPEGAVRCGVAVVAVEGRTIHLSSGERLTGRHIVVATDGAAASRLLPEAVVAPSWRQAVTLYFAAAVSPVGEPTLLLNGTGSGCIGHIVDLSRVAPRYAPAGQSLVSLSVRGAVPESDDELVALIRAEAGGWFGGDAVAAWRLLRVDRIRQALPVRWPLVRSHPVPVRDGVWVCGDHRDTASIQGAMQSGRETADAVIALS